MTEQTHTTVQAQPAAAPAHSNLLQRAAISPTITPVHSPTLQRCTATTECAECRQKREGTMQRAAVSAAPVNAVPPIVHDVLNSPGQPLDAGTRAFMEPRFGHDFSQVRVHTDERAAESARAVNALAYTVGRDVVFDVGQYAPGSSAGKRLLAHELTHTIQQGGMSVSNVWQGKLAIGRPNDMYEQEAEVQAVRVIEGHSGGPLRLNKHLGISRLQRQADIREAPPGLPCILVTGPGHIPGTDVFFELSSAALDTIQKADIATFVRGWVAAGSRDEIIVDGYASVDGPQPLNWRLSCNRAEAIKAQLITQIRALGAAIPTITTFAHGESTEFGTGHSHADFKNNRRAIITMAARPTPPPPAPTCATTPPPCPIGTSLAPLLRDSHIPSHALCRGACGPDCPSTCTPQPSISICVPDSTGSCHFTCTYNAVIECGSHAGCRNHDACFDACADVFGESSVFAPCHMGCNAQCIDAHGFGNCNSWRTGGGPFDSRLKFSDAPVPTGPFPSTCSP